MTARYIIGDIRDELAKLPDGSVDLIVTSPPFLALRSYLPADHPDKHREIGSEPDPAAFLDTMLALSAEWRRVLAPHGSICVELGDTYAGSGGAGGDWSDSPATTKARVANGSTAGPPRRFIDDRFSLLPKSLALIPSLYPACLAYGRNVLTGEPSPAGRWRIRNLIVWGRPNPPVGALGDKFRSATSLITVACVSDRRWFDLDAVRVPYIQQDRIGKTEHNGRGDTYGEGVAASWSNKPNFTREDRGGAPPLDWHIDEPDGWHIWPIPTAPYKGAHYATFPIELPKRLIEAMCPRQVCTVCGKPRRRIVGEAEYERTDSNRVPARLAMSNGDRVAEGVNQFDQTNGANTSVTRNAPTLGWTDCGHDNWRPGLVVDPFAGSGTTLAAATGLGRDCIGIDLDRRNADLAIDRVGPLLLTVEEVPT